MGKTHIYEAFGQAAKVSTWFCLAQGKILWRISYQSRIQKFEEF